ncbi:MAG: hypothetical protein ACRD0P_30195 [Stackebrandtia sp.]
MTSRFTVIGAVFVTLALTGCGGPTSGTVTSVVYEAPQLGPYTCTGGPGQDPCTRQDIPECHRVTYWANSHAESVCVSAEDFDDYEPGDHYPKP